MTFTNFNSYFILAWDSNAHIGEDPWCTRLHVCGNILWRMERRFKMLKKGKQITYEGWKEDFFYFFYFFLKNGLPSIWKEDHQNFKEKESSCPQKDIWRSPREEKKGGRALEDWRKNSEDFWRSSWGEVWRRGLTARILLVWSWAILLKDWLFQVRSRKIRILSSLYDLEYYSASKMTSYWLLWRIRTDFFPCWIYLSVSMPCFGFWFF